MVASQTAERVLPAFLSPCSGSNPPHGLFSNVTATEKWIYPQGGWRPKPGASRDTDALAWRAPGVFR